MDDLIAFTTLAGKLKGMERFRGQFYWRNYPYPGRYESVADHSWRLALLIILFADKLSQSFNTEKALKIALVHDLPEVIAGDESPMGQDGTGLDTYAYDKQKADARSEKERKAAEQLFGNLDDKKRSELLGLWHEYENQESFEAKVIKALDKIECMLQVLEYRNGEMFEAHKDFTIQYGLKYADIDPAIKEFGEKIADQIRARFKNFQK